MADGSMKFCPDCGGTGEGDCWGCDGEGTVPCPECEGTGAEGPCGTCLGTRMVLKSDYDLEAEGQLNLLDTEASK